MARPEGFEPTTPRFVGWCSYGLKDLKKAGELETFAGDAANAKGTSRQAGRAALLFKLGTKPGYTKCKKL